MKSNIKLKASKLIPDDSSYSDASYKSTRSSDSDLSISTPAPKSTPGTTCSNSQLSYIKSIFEKINMYYNFPIHKFYETRYNFKENMKFPEEIIPLEVKDIVLSTIHKLTIVAFQNFPEMLESSNQNEDFISLLLKVILN